MKLKIGTVYEIRTRRGLVYTQPTHRAEKSGVVMRLLEGFFETRPTTFDAATKFSFLLPIDASAHDDFLQAVGEVAIPADSAKFPLFRNGEPGAEGKVAVWWVWDGTSERRVGVLSAEQRKYPFREIWGYPNLIEKIESGWTPETDPR